MRNAISWTTVAGLAFLPLACTGKPKVEPATLVLNQGRIVTVDDQKPEAQALAARGDTIVAVGTNEEIAPYVGPQTRVVDLHGRLAIPGFIDGHGHFTGVGQARIVLNLTKVKNWDDVVAMVKDAALKARPGEWIRGRGWHQDKWDEKPQPAVEGFPTHHSLSSASPNNPVVLTHASGHATFANAKAMELAGVTGKTPNPPGGEILKDQKGAPTGLFRETASRLLQDAYAKAREGMTPEEREAEVRREVQLADEEVVAKGVTSFQDAGSSFETIDVFKKVAAEGKLGVRLWVMIRDTSERMATSLAAYRLIDGYDRHLTVRAIKQHHRRRPRLARGVAPRALLGPAVEHGPQHHSGRDGRGDRQARHGQRLPALRARHRRPRQPREAQHLRGRLQGQPRQEGRALAHRARAAPEPRRHPALRTARRDRVHAGDPLHVGRGLRARPAGRAAIRRRRLRLAEADEVRRGRRRTAPTRRSRTSIPSRTSTRR